MQAREHMGENHSEITEQGDNDKLSAPSLSMTPPMSAS